MKGFTLLEMLAGISIFLLLITSFYSIIFWMQNNLSVAAKESNQIEEYRAAFSLVNKQIIKADFLTYNSDNESIQFYAGDSLFIELKYLNHILIAQMNNKEVVLLKSGNFSGITFEPGKFILNPIKSFCIDVGNEEIDLCFVKHYSEHTLYGLKE